MKILQFLVLIFIAFSCTPDPYEKMENFAQENEIEFIKICASSDKIIPNGEGVIELTTIAYGVKSVSDLYTEMIDGTEIYKDTVRVDTFVIPRDQYPSNLIKIFKGNGELFKGDKFKTTDTNLDEVEFFAKINEIESEHIAVKVRQVEPTNYDELTIPIIFHVLSGPSNSIVEMKVTEDFLQEKLDILNNVFNKKRTTNPNGGSAHINFRLAEYDNHGKVLDVKGLNKIKTTKILRPTESLEYIKENLKWDHNKYLNIWICDLAAGRYSSNGSTSFKVEVPKVILEGETAIPGIDARPITDLEEEDLEELVDTGIVYNIGEFAITQNYDSNSTGFANLIGLYYGLLKMNFKEYWDWRIQEYVSNMVDGDTDFCGDTPIYDYGYSLYKKHYVTGAKFTTYNIMAQYSRQNSITYDQAKRVREVLQKCPTRWSYKSDWAFTGK
ncbi:hypothetical protein ACXR6G_09560 [Ancylomarina sp. YFZ004]